MNNVFKTKFSVAKQQVVVVSELASNKNKTASQSSPSANLPNLLQFTPPLPLFSKIAFAITLVMGLYPVVGFAADQNIILRNDLIRSTSSEEVCTGNVALNPTVKGGKLRGIPCGQGDKYTQVRYAVAVGSEANVVGRQGIAVGSSSYATAQSVAVGAETAAYGAGSVAIGSDDLTAGEKGDQGYQDQLPIATVKDIFAPLIGTFKTKADFNKSYVQNGSRQYSPTFAGGTAAVAIGARSIAARDASTALGALAMVLSAKSTAIGLRSFIAKNADNSVAIGNEARGFGESSMSLGTDSEASNNNALAYGTEAKAVGAGSVAIGQNVTTGAKLQSAFIEKNKAAREALLTAKTEGIAGFNNILDEALKSDIYERDDNVYIKTTKDIKKIKAESDDSATSNNAVAIGNKSFAIKANSMALGSYAFSNAQNGLALGSYSFIDEGANNTTAIGIGNYAGASAAESFIGGTFSSSKAANSVVLGARSSVSESGTNSVVIGKQASSTATDGIAIGTESATAQNGAMALGKQAKVEAKGSSQTKDMPSIALGQDSKVSETDEAIVRTTNAAVNGFTWSGFAGSPEELGVLSIGQSGKERKIRNVAAGEVSANSTEAINGSQLYYANLGFTHLADSLVKYLGGQASVTKENGDLGTIVYPEISESYKGIGDTEKTTIHDAIKKVATSTIKLTTNNGSTSSSQRQENTEFAIKGKEGGGITTSATGNEVSISLDDQTKETLGKVGTLETKVGQIEGNVSNLQTNVSTLQTDVAGNKRDIASLRTEVDSHSEGIAGLTKAVNKNDTNIGKLAINLREKLAEKANTSLDNITEAGKGVITGLVDVQSKSAALTVEATTDEATKKKTFNLTLTEDGIKQLAGTTNLASDISTAAEAAKTEAVNKANTYADTKFDGVALKFEGNSKTGEGEPAVNLKTQTLKIKGVDNVIKTTANGTELTIDLAEAVKTSLKNATDGVSTLNKKLGNTNFETVQGKTAPTTVTEALSQITQAVNSGWEIQGQGMKKGEIGAGKKVNFINGSLTTATVEMNSGSDTATVKFDVQTAQLQNDTTGTVSVTNPEQDGKKLVTADNVASAINAATSSLSSVLAFRGDNNKDTAVGATENNTKVNLKTETLKVLGTEGQITTTADNEGLKIGLAKKITDQLTALETTAQDVTHLKTRVGDTELTTTPINGNDTAPTNLSEAVNQLTTAVNSGWKLKGNGAEKSDIGATDAVDFIDSPNIQATVTAKTATDAAKVSFSVKTVALSNATDTGKINVPTGDDANKLVTASNLATAVNTAVDPEKLARNIKLNYTSTNNGSTTSPAKQVSLSTGLNFKSSNDNLTITAKDNGEVLFEAKDWTSDINTAKEGAISASKSYTDRQLSSRSSTLKFTGDSTIGEGENEPKVNLREQKLSVVGTSGYVTTKAEGQTVTIDLDTTLKGKLDNLPDNVKASLATINNQIGSEPTGTPTGLSAKDGLNGKNLTEKVNALRDGTAGNVVYTDPQGNRLVKGTDGEYYPADEVANKVQNPADGKWYPEGTTFNNGRPVTQEGSPASELSIAAVPKETIVATTVNPDGSTTNPTEMGNVKSSLGLDGVTTVEKVKAQEILNGTPAKDGEPAKAGLLALQGAENLNKVATVGDLQALAQAGIDFLGNDDEAKAIHKTLGSTVSIQGKDGAVYGKTGYESAKYSADNLITRNDGGTLRIEMLKAPTFEALKLAAAGSSATPVSLTPSNDGSSLTFAKNGVDGADGTDTSVELKGVAAGTDPTSAINKAQLDALKDKLGVSDKEETSAASSPAGQDGLDGKTLTAKANALRDGTAGNVVYTDPQGNRLVKGADGNYYPKDTALGDNGLPTDNTQPVDKSTIVATTVNPDGSTTNPTQMGNVKSGLGLDGSADNNGSEADPKQPKALSATAAKTVVAGTDGQSGLLTKSGAELNKVATVGDLQALAQAGIDFLGNDAEAKAIHKTLGSKVSIQGKDGAVYGETGYESAKYSADNLITHNDSGTLRIEMLKAPTFEALKLAAAGSSATPVSLTPTDDGSSLTFAKNGVDGANTPVELKGVADGTTPTSAINKAQLDEVKSQLGLSDTPERSAQNSPAGQDGLDGKTLTAKANALRDGTAGNVVYTDPDGNRLVKGAEGKYYRADQVKDKVQGPDGNWYPAGTEFKDGKAVDKNGTEVAALSGDNAPTEVAKDSIVSTVVNPDGTTTNPTQMGNVKSGLGLDGSADNNGSEADPKQPKALSATAAKTVVAGTDGQSGLLTKSGAELNKVATVGDLQALAQAGLDFAGNNSSVTVHRPLGTKLDIVGDEPTTAFESAVGNINVLGDATKNKLVIQLNKDITNIASIGGGLKTSAEPNSARPEDQKAKLTFNDDDLALNDKTLSGVKSAILPEKTSGESETPETESPSKTALEQLAEAAKNKGSSVVNVSDLAAVSEALEKKLTDKGIDFAGDSGEKVSRKLGDKVTIKGGADSTKLTDKNIGVVTDPANGSLIVKLAKEIQGITSIATEAVNGEQATFNASGLEIVGSGDKAGQTASYGLGATTLANRDSKSELTPESLTLSSKADGDETKSELTKNSLKFTKADGTDGIKLNSEEGKISNLADRTLVGQNGADGSGSGTAAVSDYGAGDNRNNAATEGALKDLADKLGVSQPNKLVIDNPEGPSGKDGLNGSSILDKIQALRDGSAGNVVYTDPKGNRLVKLADGNYYPEGTSLNGQEQPVNSEGESVSAVPRTDWIASTVNPDGSTTTPVQMGNVKSGLGLDGSAGNDGQNANSANPQALTADAAKKAIAGEDGLLTASGPALNKVATVGDLQALAQAGIDFAGNNEENVHRPLGTQLQVVGDGVDKAASDKFESAVGNINVKSSATENKLTVQLSKDLSNLNSAEFKDKEGNTTRIDSTGVTITPAAKEGETATPVSLTSAGLDNGGNRITNLAKGEDDGDAVTVEQLKALTKAVTGGDNTITVENKLVQPGEELDDGTVFEGDTEGNVFVQDGKPLLKTYNVSDQKEQVTNSVYTAIHNMNEQGIKFFHTNDGKTNQKNEASNEEDSSASGKYATAVGYNASATGENSLAVGSGSTVHGSDSISVGTGNEVFGNNSGVFGDPSIINAKSSYLVGNNGKIGEGEELEELIKQRDALTRPTRPTLAAKTESESEEDYNRKVETYNEELKTYRAELQLYMQDRDEINQKIIALSEKTENVMAMGNNIEVTQGSHGALVIGSNSYVNVVNSGLDSNIHGIAIGNNTRVDTDASSVALGSNAYAVQSLEALQSARVYAHEQAVGKGSEVIGEVSFGQEGKYRRLTNVAAGAADTDAVNVSQLKSVTSNIQQSLNNLSQDLNAVSASAAAMANLPQAYLPGKSMVAVSTGYHKGQSAIALGVSRIADNGNLVIKASASHNTRNDFTGGVGVGYQW